MQFLSGIVPNLETALKLAQKNIPDKQAFLYIHWCGSGYRVNTRIPALKTDLFRVEKEKLELLSFDPATRQWLIAKTFAFNTRRR